MLIRPTRSRKRPGPGKLDLNASPPPISTIAPAINTNTAWPEESPI